MPVASLSCLVVNEINWQNVFIQKFKNFGERFFCSKEVKLKEEITKITTCILKVLPMPKVFLKV